MKSYFVVKTLNGKDLDWWQFDDEDAALRFTSDGQVVVFEPDSWVPERPDVRAEQNQESRPE